MGLCRLLVLFSCQLILLASGHRPRYEMGRGMGRWQGHGGHQGHNHGHYSFVFVPSSSVDEEPDRWSNFENNTYYLQINLGTPPQEFEVEIDTSSDKLWVYSDRCNTNECKRHTRYTREKSSTYEPFGLRTNLEYAHWNIKGIISFDTLRIGNLTIDQQAFIEAEEVEELESDMNIRDISEGVLGLGYPDDSPTVLNNMMSSGLLEEPLFSLYFNRNRTDSYRGAIVFGGIDEKLVNKKDLRPIPIVRDPKERGNSQWVIRMDSLSFQGPRRLSFCRQGCLAVVNTSSSLFGGPPDDIQQIYRHFGAQVDSERATVDCRKAANFPSLLLSFSGMNYMLQANDYVFKVDGKCALAFYKLPNTPLRPSVNSLTSLEGKWVLGRNFIGKYYTVFNIGEKSVAFASLSNE